ncbi:hypothetical protein FJ887_004490 [Brevibacterium sp. XM4083]|nr:hypothetical protein [Brevibacterium sp. XM4083]
MATAWWDDFASHAFTYPVIAVHGWSKPLREFQQKKGVETVLITDRYGNQSRLTTQDVIDDIRHVSGVIASSVCSQLRARGINLIHHFGTDGLLTTGPSESKWWINKKLTHFDNRVGPIDQVDSSLLPEPLPGTVHLITPLARNPEGLEVNTDADRAAAAIAGATATPNLHLITDVEGVIADGKVQRQLSLAEALRVRDTNARGGMRKKLRAAGEAIEAGVERVYIGSGTLTSLNSQKTGTVISP